MKMKLSSTFRKAALAALALTAGVGQLCAASLFVEAESFTRKGGWVVDQQFMDLMGSPYLMAHGMGVAVEDASKNVNFTEDGTYHVYVRTYNWTSPWSKGAGPGKFTISVDSHKIGGILGDQGDKWIWQYAGKTKINKGLHTIALSDMTGFNGRCDAIYFSTTKTPPPSDVAELDTFRRKALGIPNVPTIQKQYDLVVAGGGIAGMCAAMSAARNGMKVALINDRPILGGCNSSEIRVHLGGRIEVEPYKNLGNMIKEFGHLKKGNAEPASNYMDEEKLRFIESNPNITLYANNRLTKVKMNGNNIASVTSQNIESGEEILFNSKLFVDCTGDGTVGALAGADFRMGRESRFEHNETKQFNLHIGGLDDPKDSRRFEKGSYLAPEKADKMTMGASVQWYSKERANESTFPAFNFGVTVNDDIAEKVKMGEWTWETGMYKNQLTDAEYVRDYGMMVIYTNWSFLKNKSSIKADYTKSQLEWVAYVAGKRESRRLLGDYILTANDLVDWVEMKDGTASTTWSIDIHYPNPDNEKNYPTGPFKSIAKHVNIYAYPVPYRCLYSRNVNNLFMAGRNISVTHAALGTIRVMRTTGMLGEVVGMAASICKKYNAQPRDVYEKYLPDLVSKMKVGAGEHGLPNNQQFNTGGHLKTKPVKK